MIRTVLANSRHAAVGNICHLLHVHDGTVCCDHCHTDGWTFLATILCYFCHNLAFCSYTI